MSQATKKYKSSGSHRIPGSMLCSPGASSSRLVVMPGHCAVLNLVERRVIQVHTKDTRCCHGVPLVEASR
jgi:hypothetical protein